MSLPHSSSHFADFMPSTPAEKITNNTEFEAAIKESSSVTRTTIGRRVLTYILEVAQQPERARACGSGVKSTADSRPLDPPPFISLVIYELKLGVQTNITFSYDASFFTFATLENVEHRSQSPLRIPLPILSGCHVSGAYYLDRPHPAIFFLFPDLSVRYEGRYRLCFNLYETVKHFDDQDDSGTDPGSVPGAQSHWRLEVKSAAFTVFSAKKFPGLLESTSLSRTVADQGCRVRIRIDVRMRRRTFKDQSSSSVQNSKQVDPTWGIVLEDGLLGASAVSSAEEKVEFVQLEREDMSCSAPMISTTEVEEGRLTREIQRHIPKNEEIQGSTVVSKASILSALIKCFPFETPCLDLSASEVSITFVDSEPRSHAIKRASHEWWLFHAEEAWENIIRQDETNDYVYQKNIKLSRLLYQIISRWHQDFVANSRGLFNGEDLMASLGTTSAEEERVVEQLIHDISQHLNRKNTGLVKQTPAQSSTRNAISGPEKPARHASYQTLKITGKRTGRDDTASGDDGMGDDDPKENNSAKRTKKSADQYNRYVICTQFAAGQDPACPNCFFGAWISVDRLKQDHLVKVHKIDVCLMKVGKGGSESEKWWRLFDKLHPRFRELNPEAFIPGPFWEDRVAHNTYNKVFSEAMKRAERIQQRSTQSLASEIEDLLNRRRDTERQEIRQVIVDILHSRTPGSISNESLSHAESVGLEYPSSGPRFTGAHTPLSQNLSSESASSSTPAGDFLPFSPATRPGHPDFLLGLQLTSISLVCLTRQTHQPCRGRSHMVVLVWAQISLMLALCLIRLACKKYIEVVALL